MCFYHFHFFFWWSIKFPEQHTNQSETWIGGFQLSVALYIMLHYLVIRYCRLFDTFLVKLKMKFSSQIRNAYALCSSNKVAVCFTIISNLAVTTHLFINNIRVDLLLNGILLTEQRIGFALKSENNFNFLEISAIVGPNGKPKNNSIMLFD